MAQYQKPKGLLGRIMARGMAWGHKDFYKNTAKVLDLKEDDKYLEIGFGSGLFIKNYASRPTKIAGLDYSEEMVNLAGKFNKKLIELGKIEFKLGDVTSIPWENNEFTVVVGIETFYFWSEPMKALKEIYRVLAPGGRIVIEMGYNRDDGLDHTKHVKKMNLKLYSSNEMIEMFKEAGFSKISVTYFKSFFIPLKGYLVTKGMIINGIKEN